MQTEEVGVHPKKAMSACFGVGKEEAEKDDDDSESAMSEEDAKAPLEDAEDEQVGLLRSLHRSFRS